ncbi:hypothetical protein L202_07651 [Cryptococcus amylolentus CBS 6039]|uniref:Myb-like domain-containing protein n=1 Tax=Cryptococcus amylolentus CBS 6039 TaxID=1295533 RepID=A0A1E3HDK4_9TREE|nr:hypothetical protein L202_07651 [Cryptococcus amylolentus CBS 6039]ODN74205.1 hypothetical protein L202_07651 [Cryptococcus amylolentus CBS 6039]
MESIELGVEDLERRFGIILPEGPPQEQDQEQFGEAAEGGKRKRSKEEKERRKSLKAEKRARKESGQQEEFGEGKKSKKDKKSKSKETQAEPVEESNDIPVDHSLEDPAPALTLAQVIDNSARHAEEEEEEKRKRKQEKKEKKRQAKGKERAVSPAVSEQEPEPGVQHAPTSPRTPASRSTAPTQYGTGKNKKRPLSIAPSSPALAADRSASTSPATPAATQMVSIDASMVEAALASASSADAAVEPPAKRAKTTKGKATKEKGKAKDKEEKKKDVEPKESDTQLRERLKGKGALDQWLATANIGKTELGRLEKAGVISYTKGKFTETEKIAIRKALEKYEKVHRMSQEEIVEMVMLKVQDAPDKEAVREFWRDIASVLPGRPILNIQPFVRRLINPYAHKGRWTPAEDALLSRAYAQHPREWKKISALVERTEQDCRDRYLKELEGGEGRVSGRWTGEEVERLEKAVRKVVKGLKSMKAELAGAPIQEGEEEEEELVDLMEDVEIPWDLVAKEMGTRSITQCRIKWRDSCSHLASSKGGLEKGDADVRTLAVIKRLRALAYPSEKHIEWSRVHDAPSLLHLTQKDVRNAFSNLKHRLVKANKEGETLAIMQTIVEKKVQRKQRSGALKEFRSDSVIGESGDEAD